MRFMVMVKANEESEAGVMPERGAPRPRWASTTRSWSKAGVMLAGEGLHPSSKGARVRFSGGKRTVIDGPFAETKELIAGFWLWQVKSKDEAIEWVKRCPNPMDGESEIEIRQVFEAEDFGAELTPELQGAGGAPARAGRSRRPVAHVTATVSIRRAPRDRGGLADRVGPADRRPRADRARRRPGRGARAGRARRRARAVAGVGRPGQPGRLAHGHREAPRDRPLRRDKRARAQARGARPRARDPSRRWPSRTSTPRSTTTSATTCCAWSSRPAIRCSRPRRASRSRCACSAG